MFHSKKFYPGEKRNNIQLPEDVSSKKESVVYENILLVENNKVAIIQDKKLIVSDYMGEKIYLKKVVMMNKFIGRIKLK